jgi:hypothetical protein
MRNIIAMTLVTLGLSGGAALAQPRGEVIVHERGGDVREVHYRNYRHRPEARFERHEERRGYRWRAGAWRWNHDEWVWAPGIYVRVR